MCDETVHQPPSGGCVLKHVLLVAQLNRATPAAFGRLCVETYQPADEIVIQKRPQPPSGGCVLKLMAALACKC